MLHVLLSQPTVTGSPPEAAWMSDKWRCIAKESGGIISTSIASIPTLPCRHRRRIYSHRHCIPDTADDFH